MNREIKFRGQFLDDGSWKYGSLVCFGDKSTIYVFKDERFTAYAVDPDTVGQFTGLKDKDGVDIYEGDITEQDAWESTIDKDGEPIRILSDRYKYQDRRVVGYIVKSPFCGFSIHSVVTVVGNIHDNPEVTQ